MFRHGAYSRYSNSISSDTASGNMSIVRTRTRAAVRVREQGAHECEQVNIGELDVPLVHKWLSIYYGPSFVPDRDLRIVHFSFQSAQLAQVEHRASNDDRFSFTFNIVFKGLDATLVSIQSQSAVEKLVKFRMSGKVSFAYRSQSRR
jgi:hypothetical protein